MIGRVVVLSQLLYCIRICDEFAHEHKWIAPASSSEATFGGQSGKHLNSCNRQIGQDDVERGSTRAIRQPPVGS